MRILLTADLHLRGDAPACRKDPDAWMEEQAQSVRQLYPIASRCDEVWIVGDLFHRPYTSTEATVQALSLLSAFPVPVRILAGNHDLKQHAIGNLDKSTIGTVFSLTNVSELSSFSNGDLRVEAFPFGTEPTPIPSCDVWLTHQLTFPDEASRPMPDLGVLAEDLLKVSDARIIATGDYHHGYIYEKDGRKVVTCGCLNIQASDMEDYVPRCYILDTATFDVMEVPLDKFGEVRPDPKRESRQELETYLEGLTDFEVPHLDFLANVEAAKEGAEREVRLAVDDVLESYVPEK